MGEAIVSLIGTAGTLGGVVVGIALGGRSQTVAWKREKAERLRSERRKLYSDFLAAARDWRAVSLAPVVQIVDVSAVSRVRHADGGSSAVRTLGLRIDIALTAETAAILHEARGVVGSLVDLAEARAEYADSLIPEGFVQACRDSEFRFVKAVRHEFGSPQIDDDLARIFFRRAEPPRGGVDGHRTDRNGSRSARDGQESGDGRQIRPLDRPHPGR